MMLTLIETFERGPMALRTREEAARLLEGLRAVYQMLPSEERGQIKTHVAKLARAQSAMENNREK